MAGMGPPPKNPDQRARRNATVAMVRLPAEGRKASRPRWPLGDDIVMTAKRDMAAATVEDCEAQLAEEPAAATAARLRRQLANAREKVTILEAQLAAQKKLETTVWSQLWKTPQAVAWERLRWNREVAHYVRLHVLAELGVMDAAKEARQWSDRLGLNPLALLRLRWEIAADEVLERREERTDDKASRARYGNLQVVAPAADQTPGE